MALTNSPIPGPIGIDRSGEIDPCPCSGIEKTAISGLGNIPSYSGGLPSPLQVMFYTPAEGEPSRPFIPDKEIRQWIREAAEYHGIPHILLAVILQQENVPSAPKWRQRLQFAERSLQTFAARLDEFFFDVVPDKFAGGSTGFANISRNTLLSAAEYSEKMYGRPPVPNREQDTRISGHNWKADLYYCAAQPRQLIDRVEHTICHQGNIDLLTLEKVLGAYNGSGPLAEKYAKDGIKLLDNVVSGKDKLYFYER